MITIPIYSRHYDQKIYTFPIHISMPECTKKLTYSNLKFKIFQGGSPGPLTFREGVREGKKGWIGVGDTRSDCSCTKHLRVSWG